MGLSDEQSYITGRIIKSNALLYRVIVASWQSCVSSAFSLPASVLRAERCEVRRDCEKGERASGAFSRLIAY